MQTETKSIAARKDHLDELAELLTVDELSALLKVKKTWIYGKLHSRTMPIVTIYVGRYPRFRLSDVARYLETQTRPSGSAA